VIITGGASGIGACFVRAFVENGAKVAFLDLQRETGAALADLLGECAARPLFVPCDLTDTAALGAAAVLVNNAANDQRYVAAGGNRIRTVSTARHNPLFERAHVGSA
jgi:NAD(P)-dependent dehydrogenase (short-subunit alcohol dehydrogenase family)